MTVSAAAALSVGNATQMSRQAANEKNLNRSFVVILKIIPVKLRSRVYIGRGFGQQTASLAQRRRRMTDTHKGLEQVPSNALRNAASGFTLAAELHRTSINMI